MPDWYRDLLVEFEPYLAGMEADHARESRATPEQVEHLRYLLYGTTGAADKAA
jgi:hypothetical protein